MAFQDVFHQVSQVGTYGATANVRIAGRNISYVRAFVKRGGLLDGHKGIHIGQLYNPDLYYYENDAPVSGFNVVPSADDVYRAFFAQGMSEVVKDQLLANPLAVGELNYDDVCLKATVIGAGGSWEFKADPTVTEETQIAERVWAVPAAAFPTFRDLALQRLSTLPSGVQASAYIAFNGADDYVNFTAGNTALGYLDWTKDWTLGITLVGYPQHSDQKYQCLFASGNNVLMIRRGGVNQALYVASNNTGYASQGINTWTPINDGDRLQFEYTSTNKHLKYFKGQPGATPQLVGTLTVNAANIAANDPGDDFAIGRGNGKTNFEELLHFDGGVNNFIGMQGPMGTTDRLSYFQSVGEAFDEQTWYPDLNSWAKLGEDPYPNVVDTVGGLTGGELINGTEEDFVPIESPTEE